MTIEECYKAIDGDFKGACSRLLSKERVAKFSIRFIASTDYDGLTQAIKSQDWEKAFLHAHTLKGLTLNLGFTHYGEVASSLTEELRGGLKSEEKAMEYYNTLSEIHKSVVAALSQYSA